MQRKNVNAAFPLTAGGAKSRCMFEDPADPRRNTPDACASMADVRYEVDRIDRLLVKLLVERQQLMDAAARIKDARDHVMDVDRVEDVVAKVLASARTQGLSPAIAEPVWRELIKRCTAHEFDTWDRTREAQPQT